MIISFNNVSKSFFSNFLFSKISFTVNENDKIGLVGVNGVGKSTLLKMILGEEKVDGNIDNLNEKGTVFINPNIKISYLSQNVNFKSMDNYVIDEIYSVFDELLSIKDKIENLSSDMNELDEIYSNYDEKDVYSIDYRVNFVVEGLNLENLKNIKIFELSGGEKTRVALAKILLEKSDLLILDEPTNHLDILTIEWLEKYLIKEIKSFIIISHDREFLDNVCNKIYEIENKKLETYNGNFSDFLFQKELILKGEIKKYEKEQEYIKKMEEFVRRYKAGNKSKQARGRQKLLDKLDRMEDPEFNVKKLKLNFTSKYDTGENVLKIKNLKVDNLFEIDEFNIYKGDKIGIIGKNGIGKSTLLKIIEKNLKYDEIELGSNVNIAYFDQDMSFDNEENTLIEEINNDLSKNEEYYKSLLSSFLFTKDDIEKKIKNLSGGEKVRIKLLKMMLKNANFLILDEPTNHLDMYSIEILEEALKNFNQTLIVVSHNRHFLSEVCNKICIIENGKLSVFDGNYEKYKENIQNEIDKKEINLSKEMNKQIFIENKNRKKEIKKNQKRIIEIEKQIDDINFQIIELQEKMYKFSTDYQKLLDIQNEIDRLKNLENNLLLEWENLSDNTE